MMNEIGICLTGHRPDKLYGYEIYDKYITEYKTNNPYFKIEDVLYSRLQ